MTKCKQVLAWPLAMCFIYKSNSFSKKGTGFFLFGYALFGKTDLNIQIQAFLLHSSVKQRFRIKTLHLFFLLFSCSNSVKDPHPEET